MYCFKFILLVGVAVCCVQGENEFPPQPPTPSPAPNITTTKPTTPTTKTTTTASTTTTTTTASTTTTKTPPTTTTTKPTTTTTQPTTTAKPTTTAPPQPPQPAPGTWSANITNTNRTCVVVQLALLIEIPTKDNKTIKIPLPTSANASGDCSGKDKESLSLTWGEGNKIEFDFNRTDKTRFQLEELMVDVNLTLPGQNATVYKYKHNKTEFSAPIDNSYKCSKQQTLQLVRLDDKNATASLIVSNVQLQAFRNATGQHFDSPLDCESAHKTDVVPIVVGCVLAGLVVLFLVGYLVGRKRCQARGYLSM